MSENWGNFGGGGGGDARRPGSRAAERNTRANLNRNRNKRFEDWIQNDQPSRRPALNFKHTLLPHVPWQYLPDGKQYRRRRATRSPACRASPTRTDADRVLLQRHLLQTGFADHELERPVST